MLRIFVTALLVVIATPALAYTSSADQSRITDADVSRLKPGEFIWEPWLAPDGRMTIAVNLHAQRASVYRDGVRIGATTISSGKPRYRTPTGVFRILQKYRVHRSKKYQNAPMPFTQRFTRSGVALHGGGVPGYPSSHGCVHLPRSFAKLLFEETSLGTMVVVTNPKPAPAMDDNRPALAATDAGSGSSSWTTTAAAAE
jgi:hypothetical protein